VTQEMEKSTTMTAYVHNVTPDDVEFVLSTDGQRGWVRLGPLSVWTLSWDSLESTLDEWEAVALKLLSEVNSVRDAIS
jgi:hypothetical protein